MGVAGKASGNGDGVGDNHQFFSRGVPVGGGRALRGALVQQAGEGLGGGAGVDQDASGRVFGDEGKGGLGDAELFRLALDGPLNHAFLTGAEAVRRDCPAVHAAKVAGGFEGSKVAADGLRRNAESIRKVSDADPSTLGDELGDQLLALLGKHIPSIAYKLSVHQ